MSELAEATAVERGAIRLANWILRTFAGRYTQFYSGAIEYGMRACARDVAEGRPTPPDWRRDGK